MECRTFKIKLDNNEKKDNILLAIHCPYEVFYLSVKDSALKDIPDDEKCKYYITESDFYDGDEYVFLDLYLSSLVDIFLSKDFKEYCYVCSKISMDRNAENGSYSVTKLTQNSDDDINIHAEDFSVDSLNCLDGDENLEDISDEKI